jgi:hypothetical protein
LSFALCHPCFLSRDVCGKAGWRNEYRDIPNNGGVECGISIKIDSEWVTKWDAAENTQVEAVKGGRSGAMKRAAVQWGIGRYLYNLEEGFAQTSLDKKQGWHRAKLKDGTGFYWLPPSLPGWAIPASGIKPSPEIGLYLTTLLISLREINSRIFINAILYPINCVH